MKINKCVSVQRITLFDIYVQEIPDKVCLCMGSAYIRLHTHTKNPQWSDPTHVFLAVKDSFLKEKVEKNKNTPATVKSDKSPLTDVCELCVFTSVLIAAAGADLSVSVQAGRCGLCGSAGSPECS